MPTIWITVTSPAVPLQKDEQLIMVTDSYLNKEAFLRVSELADRDPTIAALFDELMTIIDISRVTRAEFELAQV
ncbi:hypothetical protein CU102_24160 [Phyllobacterium brassicacearum]|uniref:Uncharacterized protein n=1 Tax=Phyllobacterium brassicacearum TaxID=314235 RepID=A0A2P7BA81_9HYPH|nr:hypothetical protein CU102_24160 [Phyllobacterium brassicacearum]